MKSQIRHIDDHGVKYDALAFICPGCIAMVGGSGLHLLPINTTSKSPAWTWNGNLEKPTLSPSILTGRGSDKICHCFLQDGVFHFLSDCNHELKDQYVDIPDLPKWFTDETETMTNE